MKRHRALFSQVCSFSNLLLAARRSQLCKRYRPEVLAFNFYQEDEIHRLRRELLEGAWQPGRHRHFRIFEPKERWISAAPYRDRVVHHALCNVIEPLVDRRLISDCWANRKGKGSHRGVLRYQQFAGRFRYALKVDVQKYFPSVDHQILKSDFRRLFKDPELLHLMDLIVDRGEVPEPFHAYFPEDDLFSPWTRRKGLPIGNLTSQLWANLYLGSFDHWVKQDLKAKAYLRFVDDFILLSNSRETLIAWKAAVVEKLAELRLRMHPRKSVIRRTDEGVPFLGYVVWPSRIRIRGEAVRRYRRRLRKKATGEGMDAASREKSLAAWRGHVGLAGSWRRLGRLG